MEIVYFELNNWCCGENYPNDEPFIEWMRDMRNIKFRDEKWVTDNKLVVVESVVDMSINYCITATKNWVLENCPKILTEFVKFIRLPEKGEDVPEGTFGCPFLEYTEENIGVHYAIEEADECGYWYYRVQ